MSNWRDYLFVSLTKCDGITKKAVRYKFCIIFPRLTIKAINSSVDRDRDQKHIYYQRTWIYIILSWTAVLCMANSLISSRFDMLCDFQCFAISRFWVVIKCWGKIILSLWCKSYLKRLRRENKNHESQNYTEKNILSWKLLSEEFFWIIFDFFSLILWNFA